ncbi:hypothetical protein KIPB_001825, partial [Kipferlia bialata]
YQGVPKAAPQALAPTCSVSISHRDGDPHFRQVVETQSGLKQYQVKGREYTMYIVVVPDVTSPATIQALDAMHHRFLPPIMMTLFTDDKDMAGMQDHVTTHLLVVPDTLAVTQRTFSALQSITNKFWFGGITFLQARVHRGIPFCLGIPNILAYLFESQQADLARDMHQRIGMYYSADTHAAAFKYAGDALSVFCDTWNKSQAYTRLGVSLDAKTLLKEQLLVYKLTGTPLIPIGESPAQKREREEKEREMRERERVQQEERQRKAFVALTPVDLTPEIVLDVLSSRRPTAPIPGHAMLILWGAESQVGVSHLYGHVHNSGVTASSLMAEPTPHARVAFSSAAVMDMDKVALKKNALAAEPYATMARRIGEVLTEWASASLKVSVVIAGTMADSANWRTGLGMLLQPFGSACAHDITDEDLLPFLGRAADYISGMDLPTFHTDSRVAKDFCLSFSLSHQTMLSESLGRLAILQAQSAARAKADSQKKREEEREREREEEKREREREAQVAAEREAKAAQKAKAKAALLERERDTEGEYGETDYIEDFIDMLFDAFPQATDRYPPDPFPQEVVIPKSTLYLVVGARYNDQEALTDNLTGVGISVRHVRASGGQIEKISQGTINRAQCIVLSVAGLSGYGVDALIAGLIKTQMEGRTMHLFASRGVVLTKPEITPLHSFIARATVSNDHVHLLNDMHQCKEIVARQLIDEVRIEATHTDPNLRTIVNRHIAQQRQREEEREQRRIAELAETGSKADFVGLPLPTTAASPSPPKSLPLPVNGVLKRSANPPLSLPIPGLASTTSTSAASTSAAVSKPLPLPGTGATPSTSGAVASPSLPLPTGTPASTAATAPLPLPVSTSISSATATPAAGVAAAAASLTSSVPTLPGSVSLYGGAALRFLNKVRESTTKEGEREGEREGEVVALVVVPDCIKGAAEENKGAAEYVQRDILDMLGVMAVEVDVRLGLSTVLGPKTSLDSPCVLVLPQSDVEGLDNGGTEAGHSLRAVSECLSSVSSVLAPTSVSRGVYAALHRVDMRSLHLCLFSSFRPLTHSATQSDGCDKPCDKQSEGVILQQWTAACLTSYTPEEEPCDMTPSALWPKKTQPLPLPKALPLPSAPSPSKAPLPRSKVTSPLAQSVSLAEDIQPQVWEAFEMPGSASMFDVRDVSSRIEQDQEISNQPVPAPGRMADKTESSPASDTESESVEEEEEDVPLMPREPYRPNCVPLSERDVLSIDATDKKDRARLAIAKHATVCDKEHNMLTDCPVLFVHEEDGDSPSLVESLKYKYTGHLSQTLLKEMVQTGRVSPVLNRQTGQYTVHDSKLRVRALPLGRGVSSVLYDSPLPVSPDGEGGGVKDPEPSPMPNDSPFDLSHLGDMDKERDKEAETETCECMDDIVLVVVEREMMSRLSPMVKACLSRPGVSLLCIDRAPIVSKTVSKEDRERGVASEVLSLLTSVHRYREGKAADPWVDRCVVALPRVDAEDLPLRSVAEAVAEDKGAKALQPSFISRVDSLPGRTKPSRKRRIYTIEQMLEWGAMPESWRPPTVASPLGMDGELEVVADGEGEREGDILQRFVVPDTEESYRMLYLAQVANKSGPLLAKGASIPKPPRHKR